MRRDDCGEFGPLAWVFFGAGCGAGGVLLGLSWSPALRALAAWLGG